MCLKHFHYKLFQETLIGCGFVLGTYVCASSKSLPINLFADTLLMFIAGLCLGAPKMQTYEHLIDFKSQSLMKIFTPIVAVFVAYVLKFVCARYMQVVLGSYNKLQQTR